MGGAQIYALISRIDKEKKKNLEVDDKTKSRSEKKKRKKRKKKKKNRKLRNVPRFVKADFGRITSTPHAYLLRTWNTGFSSLSFGTKAGAGKGG